MFSFRGRPTLTASESCSYLAASTAWSAASLRWSRSFSDARLTCSQSWTRPSLTSKASSASLTANSSKRKPKTMVLVGIRSPNSCSSKTTKRNKEQKVLEKGLRSRVNHTLALAKTSTPSSNIRNSFSTRSRRPTTDAIVSICQAGTALMTCLLLLLQMPAIVRTVQKLARSPWTQSWQSLTTKSTARRTELPKLVPALPFSSTNSSSALELDPTSRSKRWQGPSHFSQSHYLIQQENLARYQSNQMCGVVIKSA